MGKGRKGKSRGSGLFKPPRWKYLSEIVSFENPSKARKSARALLESVKEAKRRDKALREARALTYAANRAKASLNRKNLSPKERRETKEVYEIYRKAAERAWEIYNRRFGD